ncbi:hypothetical protein BG015_001260 [Linnemannia schmuckeri]|uniref:Uncharacterized protein n=1 Tax=Linnemannia schmuckeri TaxID=64567 RepID=A0A9P5V6X8_9FUNG|nr:hypothetical protein BG015_001260 [Linnemannia schmuckeri]
MVHAQGNGAWGTIVPTLDGLQANNWLLRVQHFRDIVDSAILETAAPTTPTAPIQSTRSDSMSLKPQDVNFGSVAGATISAHTNAILQSLSENGNIPMPGVSFGLASIASCNIKLPGDIVVELPSISSVVALSRPGKPVQLGANYRGGSVSSGGQVFNLPSPVPVNFKIRLPADVSAPPYAVITFNEQVTTDQKGSPTLGPDGDYQYDPKATSGYINLVHITIQEEPQMADITVGHAAVIRDPAKTDRFTSQSASLPGYICSDFEIC